MIVKSGSMPMSRAWMRSRRAAPAWKVPPQTRSDAPPVLWPRAASTASTRRSISAAARRVNVSSRMRRGSAPRSMRMGDALHERGRLAGAGAGDDEQRTVAVLGGGELLGVELDEHGESSSVGCARG